ncbi:hypothetical protein ABIF96_005751 [Bradyrhizobium ottawaense]
MKAALVIATIILAAWLGYSEIVLHPNGVAPL